MQLHEDVQPVLQKQLMCVHMYENPSIKSQERETVDVLFTEYKLNVSKGPFLLFVQPFVIKCQRVADYLVLNLIQKEIGEYFSSEIVSVTMVFVTSSSSCSSVPEQCVCMCVC